MRQIVRNKRQIVQSEAVQARLVALTTGTADATAWHGKTRWFSWSLEQAIGYLLPLNQVLETTCVAGVVNRIRPGEMLIINRGESDSYRLQLCGTTIEDDKPKAAMGHIRLKSRTDTLANAPTRAMSVVALNARELERVATLSCLVANESQLADDARPRLLLSHLEKALYEALAALLCTCDPLELPPLVAMTDRRIAAALMAMNHDCARAWRLDTMAREAALSRTLFATRFKLMLGVTPLEYLTGLRVQRAATLKSETPKRSLHDIAQAVGYADESSLRRAYSRVARRDL
jgi:AraC-like DNA-binding protein